MHTNTTLRSEAIRLASALKGTTAEREAIRDEHAANVGRGECLCIVCTPGSDRTAQAVMVADLADIAADRDRWVVQANRALAAQVAAEAEAARLRAELDALRF